MDNPPHDSLTGLALGWWNGLSGANWFCAKVTVLPNVEKGQFVWASRTVMPNMSPSGFRGGLLLPPGPTRVDATLLSWAEQEAGILHVTVPRMGNSGQGDTRICSRLAVWRLTWPPFAPVPCG